MTCLIQHIECGPARMCQRRCLLCSCQCTCCVAPICISTCTEATQRMCMPRLYTHKLHSMPSSPAWMISCVMRSPHLLHAGDLHISYCSFSSSATHIVKSSRLVQCIYIRLDVSAQHPLHDLCALFLSNQSEFSHLCVSKLNTCRKSHINLNDHMITAYSLVPGPAPLCSAASPACGNALHPWSAAEGGLGTRLHSLCIAWTSLCL